MSDEYALTYLGNGWVEIDQGRAELVTVRSGCVMAVKCFNSFASGKWEVHVVLPDGSRAALLAFDKKSDALAAYRHISASFST